MLNVDGVGRFEKVSVIRSLRGFGHRKLGSFRPKLSLSWTPQQLTSAIALLALVHCRLQH